MFRPLPRLLLAVLPALAGCAHLHQGGPHGWRPSDSVPDEMKSCVYVFLIEPLSPVSHPRLGELAGYIDHLGYGKTFVGQTVHGSYFAEKMRWLHGQCGCARFVVIGSGCACGEARKLAGRAAADGLPVELAVYLEPDGGPDPWAEVEAPSAFTLRAADLTKEGKDGELEPVRKAELPTHPDTLALIDRELARVGMTVPPPTRPEAKRVVLVPPIPAPRDTPARPRPLPEDWQFLCPRHPYDIPPLTPRLAPETLPLPKPDPAPPARILPALPEQAPTELPRPKEQP